VPHLETAARRYSQLLGIGPFYIAEYQSDRFADVMYRGQPGKLQMRTAIAYAGAVQIEFIEPIGEYPCCYRDTVPAGQEAFHHLCFWSHDLQADIERYRSQGCEVANRGRMRGGPAFAYVDATRSLGCMVELLEYGAGIAAVFDKWRAAGAAWSGGELFVYL
jgi:hypothetical protein